jgi:aminoglycoside phosphotransferase family enzyme/predicted kinase
MEPKYLQHLLCTSSYTHKCTHPITFKETALSWIILTGEYAYKIKKPRNLPYCDFSSVDHRRYFCHQEVILNKRTAPQIYLGVVAIEERPEGGTSVIEENLAVNPIEYAVKMRQFDEKQVLRNILLKNKIDPSLLRILARDIARFHILAQPVSTIDNYRYLATLESIWSISEANYRESEPFIDITLEKNLRDKIAENERNFFSSHSLLISSRIKNDFIRDCHGDLHTGNICLYEGRYIPFDCIEFNPKFRYIDSIADVAFLSMDLRFLNNPHLASVFLSEYCEHSGDWEGLKLIRFYEARHAFVRGKVMSNLLLDPDHASGSDMRLKSEASKYFSFALERLKIEKGRIIVVCGLSGSGKSWLARKLIGIAGGIQIRSDAVRKHLGKVPLAQKAPSILYDRVISHKVYQQLIELSLGIACSGENVFLDAAFLDNENRDQLLKLASDRKVDIQFVVTTINEKERLSRVKRRRLSAEDPVSDADESIAQAQRFAAFSSSYSVKVFEVDTEYLDEAKLRELTIKLLL